MRETKGSFQKEKVVNSVNTAKRSNNIRTEKRTLNLAKFITRDDFFKIKGLNTY